MAPYLSPSRAEASHRSSRALLPEIYDTAKDLIAHCLSPRCIGVKYCLFYPHKPLAIKQLQSPEWRSQYQQIYELHLCPLTAEPEFESVP